MTTKFEGEKARVELLMAQLGIRVDEYRDPNADAGRETGVDVVAVMNGKRVGIQVTDVDTGDLPGEVRKTEKNLAGEARNRGSVSYSGWGQNNVDKLIVAIQRTIARKARRSFDTFDQVWLLICAGVSEPEAVVATFVMSLWIDAGALNNATVGDLSKSKYSRAFFYPILGVERALYQWERSGQWQKLVRSAPPDLQGPSFQEVITDPEWLADPSGKALREAEKALQEFRERYTKQP